MFPGGIPPCPLVAGPLGALEGTPMAYITVVTSPSYKTPSIPRMCYCIHLPRAIDITIINQTKVHWSHLLMDIKQTIGSHAQFLHLQSFNTGCGYCASKIWKPHAPIIRQAAWYLSGSTDVTGYFWMSFAHWQSDGEIHFNRLMAHLYYKYSSMAQDVMVMWIDLYDYSKSNPPGRRLLETEVVTRNQSHPTHLLVGHLSFRK